MDGKRVKMPNTEPKDIDLGYTEQEAKDLPAKKAQIENLKKNATPVVDGYDKYARSTRNFYYNAFDKADVTVKELDKFIYEPVDSSGRDYSDINTLNKSLRSHMKRQDLTVLQEQLGILEDNNVVGLQITESEIVGEKKTVIDAKNKINNILNSSFKDMTKGLKTEFGEAPLIAKNEAARKLAYRYIGGNLHNKEFYIMNKDGSVTEGSALKKEDPLAGKAGQDILINLLNSGTLENTDYKLQSVQVADGDFQMTDISSDIYNNKTSAEKSILNSVYSQPLFIDVYNKQLKKAQRIIVQNNDENLKSPMYAAEVNTERGLVPYRQMKAKLNDPNTNIDFQLSNGENANVEKISSNKYIVTIFDSAGDVLDTKVLDKGRFTAWERRMLYNQMNNPFLK